MDQTIELAKSMTYSHSKNLNTHNLTYRINTHLYSTHYKFSNKREKTNFWFLSINIIDILLK